MPTIIIIGGGFCGVSLTHALARRPWPGGLRIVVVDHTGRFGRGAAYSTTHPSHLLNVPAGRMGALADDESHFLTWLRRGDSSVAGDAFVPRSAYGDYLEHLFNEARSHAASGVTIEARHDRAIAVHTGEGSPRVALASGEMIEADRVVLATGNLPPRDVDGVSAIAGQRAYVSDPWAAGALGAIAGASSVLLVGTGLTMVDVVLALHQHNPDAHFVAVSRHGMLPHPHRDAPTRPVGIPSSRWMNHWNGSASELLRILRDEAHAAADAGMDWRDVVNGLRPFTPALWSRMPAREQARFYRHIRPFWDTHRHRMSQRVAVAIEELAAADRLSIVAGRIAACAFDGHRVAVDVRRRSGETERPIVDAVINCTGPCTDLARTTDPLFADLRARRLITPDPLGIGLITTDDGAVVDSAGRASNTMFTLGGTRRPALWESTAVPELREQAGALAGHLRRSLV
ncbi:MAG TPA: FAD/NAD(P)-binding protein [Candidatus Krumholzibacteria bacterium]